MKRAKRPGRVVLRWWESGPYYVAFAHPDIEREWRVATQWRPLLPLREGRLMRRDDGVQFSVVQDPRTW